MTNQVGVLLLFCFVLLFSGNRAQPNLNVSSQAFAILKTKHKEFFIFLTLFSSSYLQHAIFAYQIPVWTMPYARNHLPQMDSLAHVERAGMEKYATVSLFIFF